MKSIDLFCASQASTAICSSTDQRAMVRHGTRPVDHHINDWKKPRNIPIINPCSSQPPINPKPYHQKSRKSASDSASAYKQVRDRQVIRRKSSADINDLTGTTTPHGSSRYLLSDKPFIDLLPETDNLPALVVSTQPLMPRSLSSNDSLIISNDNSKLAASQSLRPRRQMMISSNDSLVLKSSSTRSRARYQVVELMVSIHCKGCEGKVRKHISRMEGVTSFSIDRETKKVTVIGNVTPLGVLSSISRVKNARFWPSPSSSSSSST